MNKIKSQGFTLIELMIVVAVVSILAYLATGSFGENVIAAKRTDGRTGILNVASTLEKCKAIYGTYNNGNCSVNNGDSIPSPEGLYNVSVGSTATAFALTANPAAGKSQTNDSMCTSIRLNHLGQQTGTGSDSDVCW